MAIEVENVPVRSGTAADWAATTLVLGVGEQGFETDTGKSKHGDGTSSWAALDYDAGGGGETDGVGAVFFGGLTIAADLDNTANYVAFETTDDPPRAPQRDDLMVVDGEDDTTISIVRSGLYDISLNVPVRLRDVAYVADPGLVDVIGKLQVEVNGGNEPPAYDYNFRVYWNVTEEGTQLTYAVNLTFAQVLLAGDTLQLSITASQAGLASITGTMDFNPDITFVLTYRGPATL